MSWIAIGVLAGSLIVSGHDTKEACEGRVVTLKETKDVLAKCVEGPKNTYFSTSGTMMLCQSGTCSTR